MAMMTAPMRAIAERLLRETSDVDTTAMLGKRLARLVLKEHKLYQQKTTRAVQGLRRDRRNAGLCEDCGDDSPGGYRLCKRCTEKERTRKRVSTAL